MSPIARPACSSDGGSAHDTLITSGNGTAPRTAIATREADLRSRFPTRCLAAAVRRAAPAIPVAISLAAAACGAARTGAPVPRPFPTTTPAVVETGADARAAPPGRWSGADFPRYLALVEEVETGGDCLARPAGGSALGCYQMTRAALVDAGFKDAAGGWRDNPWGVDSDDEFLRSRRAQDAAMLQYTARNWLRLEPCVQDLIGRTVGGVTLDQAALVAGAHLLGATGVVRFVRCGLHARCLSREVGAGNGGRDNLRASALRRMQAARGLRVLAPSGRTGSRCRLRG
jgi:hypothetical protein